MFISNNNYYYYYYYYFIIIINYVQGILCFHVFLFLKFYLSSPSFPVDPFHALNSIFPSFKFLLPASTNF